MRRQKDDQLRGWAHQVSQRLRQEGWPAAYLVYHGSPGSEAASSAHVENTQNLHVLELEDVTVDDLARLRELLVGEGVGDVTVKQVNAGGSQATSAKVARQAGP